MLKLKLQYFGHLMRTDSLENTLMLGKIEGRRRRGQQRMRWLDGITNFMDRVWASFRWCEGQGSPACCLKSEIVGQDWGTEEQQQIINWIMGRHHKKHVMQLAMSFSLECMAICLPFHDLSGYKPNFAQGRAKRRRGKYENGKARRDGYDNSFGFGLLSCLENSCLI